MKTYENRTFLLALKDQVVDKLHGCVHHNKYLKYIKTIYSGKMIKLIKNKIQPYIQLVY